MHVECVDEKDINKIATCNVASTGVRFTIVTKKTQHYLPF